MSLRFILSIVAHQKFLRRRLAGMFICDKRIATIFAFFCWTVCQTINAYESSHSPHGTTAALTISVDIQGKSLALLYRFSAPVPTVRFQYESGMIRKSSWRVRDSDLRLEDNGIYPVNGDAFDSLIIDVSVDRVSFDRVYPCLRAMSESGLVFLTRYAMLEDIDISEVRVRKDTGIVVAHSGFLSTGTAQDFVLPGVSEEEGAGRYVYFGRKALVEGLAGGFLVSDDDSPGWLIEHLRQAIAPAAAWLSDYFSSDSVHRPFVLVTFDNELRHGRWRGDVSSGGELFLRFYGEGWANESVELNEVIELFLAHELVHLENSVRFPRRKGEPAWLSEGLAEYLAILYAADSNGLSGMDLFHDRLLGHGSRCISNLASKLIGISDPSMQWGAYPYACGVLAFWIADGGSSSLDYGNQLRTIWSSLVASLQEQNREEYGVADILAALDANEHFVEKDLLLALIQGANSEMWQRVNSLLSEVGIEIAHEYNDEWAATALSSLINHALALSCKAGPRGFWTFPDHIRLDTGNRCGPLSGDPRIDTIQGFSIFGAMQDAYDSARKACRNGDVIQFGGFESSDTLSVTCEQPLSNLSPSPVLQLK